MTKPTVSPIEIIKIDGENINHTHDLLAVEEPMEIRVGYGLPNGRKQKRIAVTMRTPGNDFELAAGFLLTEGIIESIKQIYKIQYCTEANTVENLENIVRVELTPEIEIDFGKLQRNFFTTSSCGICGKESIEAIKTVCRQIVENTQLTISRNIILSLPDKLRAQQNVFEYTGGLHACALFDKDGKLLLLREDVGRHNALDKLIGASLSNDSFKANTCILLLSGRASFELLQKATMAGIAIVCAVGAPSSLAAATAKEFHITLIGFLRAERFNIYTNPQRIV